MTDKRQKIIDEIQKQIREQRDRIDPKLLKLAEDAIFGRGKKNADGSEPYDRETAKKAVELFLKNHDDARGFQVRLLELLKKNSH